MRRILGGVVAVLLLAGCGGPFPADPDGTLQRVTGGTLRVGVSANDPWTAAEPGGPPGGLEVDLVTEFAESLDAGVEFTVGGEEDLIGRM